MRVVIDVPPLQFAAIVYRLADEGYLGLEEAEDLLMLQITECGRQTVDYLLTCDTEEIRRMCRAYTILVHGA